MRPWLLVLALSGCSGSAFPGDALCAADGGCPSGQACVHVTRVLTSDGRCLESTGADVCRAVCGTCPTVQMACGCVCPN
ncbi:MAG: hypothetical protein AMXMBFR34_15250 [Myxococcaceae bacterium]